VTIEHAQGDLVAADVDALVNPVNTVGVMGRGLALQIKNTFPDVFEEYARACRRREVNVGRVHVVTRTTSPHFVINFPTKAHWRNPSKLEYIDAGLADLIIRVRELGIRSIAIPPLGCGLGGLDWNEVKRRIIEAFRTVPDVRVVLFEPSSPTNAEIVPRARAALTSTDGLSRDESVKRARAAVQRTRSRSRKRRTP
jgi:O-acetyl-ADP-ribose deacetylase (regulator of RNase III)